MPNSGDGRREPTRTPDFNVGSDFPEALRKWSFLSRRGPAPAGASCARNAAFSNILAQVAVLMRCRGIYNCVSNICIAAMWLWYRPALRGGWLGCGRDRPCSVSLWLPLHQNSLQSVHCLTTNIRSSTFSKIRNWSLDRSIALFGPGTMCNRLKGHRTPPIWGDIFECKLHDQEILKLLEDG